MNRSFAYALAGVMLTGVALWIVQTRHEGELLSDNPLEEVDRMMDHTRKRLSEIQQNISEFRQVLTQATAIDQPTASS